MKKLIIILLSILAFTHCKKQGPIVSGTGLDDWTESTHGINATPNYTKIFNPDAVQRLDIVIGEDYWNVMQADLDSLYGNVTQGPPTPGQPPQAFSSQNPKYVPCQVYYEGTQWYDVGIRYKGNSSLRSAYQQGNNKLPFRLEFNHFENENPAIYGQSFYGFHQLSFSSGFKDQSCIREKITPELFREYGIPCAHTAFYEIYIDHGSGPIYYGLYTMVEVIFDSMIKESYSGNGSGNCWKPDSDGAYLNDVSVFTDATMPNKTNPGIYTEVINLVNVLKSSDRTTNPAQWRANLESVFDMDQYLKYLAANTTIANWDTYGKMTHNYYLYANPTDGLLNWIPWDNNESLNTNGSMPTLLFDFSNMQNNKPAADGTTTWPMIRYIYDDTTYKTQYQQNIDAFIASAFSVSNLQDKINYNANLVQQYVEAEQPGYTYLNSISDFTTAISDLNSYAQVRWNQAAAYTP